MEMELFSPLIGQGRTAQVFRWNESQILKLFSAEVQVEEVEREAAMTRAAYEAGIPVCQVFETIKVSQRYGIIYQYIQGTTMQMIIQEKPWEGLRMASILAELHHRIHACKLTSYPSQRNALTIKICGSELVTEKAKEEALHILGVLPECDRLCHGDFHPDNILFTCTGPMIIDWFKASVGNPLADVALTQILLRFGTPQGKKMPFLMKLGRILFERKYATQYVHSSQTNLKTIQAWELPVAVGHLTDFQPQEQNRIKTRINHLLSRSDHA